MSVAETPIAELLERARLAWSTNQVICDRPSYQDQPESRYLAEILSMRITEVELSLRDFTRSPNQWLVAHALMCFDLAHSTGFLSEYERLCDDPRHVSFSYYSFGHQLSIGAVVRRLRKKYATSPHPPIGLAFAILKANSFRFEVRQNERADGEE